MKIPFLKLLLISSLILFSFGNIPKIKLLYFLNNILNVEHNSILSLFISEHFFDKLSQNFPRKIKNNFFFSFEKLVIDSIFGFIIPNLISSSSFISGISIDSNPFILIISS